METILKIQLHNTISCQYFLKPGFNRFIVLRLKDLFKWSGCANYLLYKFLQTEKPRLDSFVVLWAVRDDL